MVPKDVAMLASFSQIAVVARYGPHQGEYQWHCHNLIHEDEGLMATYNSTHYIRRPPYINDTLFVEANYQPERFEGGWDETPNYGFWFGRDPIVRSVPGTYIGENLGMPDSMPPWAHRTQSDGSPIPMDEDYLRQILQRNYYQVFYPEDRDSLEERSPSSMWAPVCPAQGSSPHPSPGPGSTPPYEVPVFY